MTHYRFVAEVIFKRNINHCYLNFYASTSQPQNVLNLSLIFYQFQSYCSYKVSSSVKKGLFRGSQSYREYVMQQVHFYNPVQKILEKLRKLRKSCKNKRNINRTYNEKPLYNCLQQLPTLRLKILRNWGIWVKGNEKLKMHRSTQSFR